MGRLHCPTCSCGDEPSHAGIVDTRAPFYGLVIEVDRLLLAEQRAAFARTRKGTT